MRRLLIGLAASALLVASAAYAVKPGENLYIKTKDAKLLEKPDAKAKVLGTLKAGQEVKWKGSDAKNKLFHSIEAGGKQGFTLQQNLSPNKPQMEIASDDGKPIDPQAFASSGAATKALSDAALTYAAETPDAATLTKGLLTAEGIAKSVPAADAQAYVAKQTGGAK
ncbi:MAG: SH3 domain-containing protein [Myxococcales bacterium]|nr:SH3 domain-containing protein [Myxococcales bacterium]